MEKKVTRKDVLNAVIAATDVDKIYEVEGGVAVSGADIIDYAERTIAQIDKKNASAKAKKAEAADALRDAIYSVLTEEPAVISDIAKAVEGEDVTNAKIVARLTALVKDGKVEKSEVKLENGRKVKAYALA